MPDCCVFLRWGITPACAGKRISRFSQYSWDRDHPRVRGEKPYSTKRTHSAAGSPPRARGKDFHFNASSDVYGITPACAGKRLTPRELYSANGDHPRVRGEKVKSKAGQTFRRGSPPRARGKVADVIQPAVGAGITPACAGKRYSLRPHSNSQWDHPRVRGEKYSNPGDLVFDPGSPPRARGKAVRPG